MKTFSYKLFFLTQFIIIHSISLFAQDEKKYNFIGINPSVTVEPYYNKNEYDISIFPLIYQRTLTRRIDIRFTSILNLGVRNNGNNISHLGLETAFPIFFKKKQTGDEISNGFYIAPILCLSRNRFEQHNNLGLWVEPGYNLLFSNRFAMTFGLQFGGTYFAYDNKSTNWGNHFGIKITLGKWF